MRLFALKDSTDPEGSTLAVLTCYEKDPAYFIDMPERTDPWTVPFILSSFAKRGEWEIDAEWSRAWVESRLVPQSRQNLGEVLRENGLDHYDTLKLLEMTEGRNSQDDCYLVPLHPDDAPKWFAERESMRVVEAVALEGMRLLVAFRTGEVRLIDRVDLETQESALARVLCDEAAFAKAEPTPGGRGVRWGSAIAIGNGMLASMGQPIPLSWNDLSRIAPALLVDARETAQALGCSRQNVNALVKRGALCPAKTGDRATLFLHAEVLARRDLRIPAGVPRSKPSVRYAFVST